MMAPEALEPAISKNPKARSDHYDSRTNSPLPLAPSLPSPSSLAEREPPSPCSGLGFWRHSAPPQQLPSRNLSPSSRPPSRALTSLKPTTGALVDHRPPSRSSSSVPPIPIRTFLKNNFSDINDGMAQKREETCARPKSLPNAKVNPQTDNAAFALVQLSASVSPPNGTGKPQPTLDKMNNQSKRTSSTHLEGEEHDELDGEGEVEDGVKKHRGEPESLPHSTGHRSLVPTTGSISPPLTSQHPSRIDDAQPVSRPGSSSSSKPPPVTNAPAIAFVAAHPSSGAILYPYPHTLTFPPHHPYPSYPYPLINSEPETTSKPSQTKGKSTKSSDTKSSDNSKPKPKKGSDTNEDSAIKQSKKSKGKRTGEKEIEGEKAVHKARTRPATAVGVNDDGSRKRRHRQALSCLQCKTRKVKCDRQPRCANCTRRGEYCQWAGGQKEPPVVISSKATVPLSQSPTVLPLPAKQVQIPSTLTSQADSNVTTLTVAPVPQEAPEVPLQLTSQEDFSKFPSPAQNCARASTHRAEVPTFEPLSFPLTFKGNPTQFQGPSDTSQPPSAHSASSVKHFPFSNNVSFNPSNVPLAASLERSRPGTSGSATTSYLPAELEEVHAMRARLDKLETAILTRESDSKVSPKETHTHPAFSSLRPNTADGGGSPTSSRPSHAYGIGSLSYADEPFQSSQTSGANSKLPPFASSRPSTAVPVSPGFLQHRRGSMSKVFTERTPPKSADSEGESTPSMYAAATPRGLRPKTGVTLPPIRTIFENREVSFRPPPSAGMLGSPLSAKVAGESYSPATDEFCEGSRKIGLEIIPNDKKECDSMVVFFFEKLDFIHRVLHRPSFMVSYEFFWCQLQSRLSSSSKIAESPTESHWAALFLVILALALHFSSPEASALPFTKHPNAAQFISAAKSLLFHAQNGSFMSKPSLEGIQALILMDIWNEDVNNEQERAISLGMAINACKAMGFHRAARPRSLDAIQDQIAKRCWWTLFKIDAFNAPRWGYSNNIHPHQSSITMPANLEDDELIARREMPPTRPLTEVTTMTFQLALSSFAQFARHSVEIYNIQGGSIPARQAIDLAYELRAIYFDKTPPCLRPDVAPTSTSTSTNHQLPWERIQMALIFHSQIFHLLAKHMSAGFSDNNLATAADFCRGSARAVLALVSSAREVEFPLLKSRTVLETVYEAALCITIELHHLPYERQSAAGRQQALELRNFVGAGVQFLRTYRAIELAEVLIKLIAEDDARRYPASLPEQQQQQPQRKRNGEGLGLAESDRQKKGPHGGYQSSRPPSAKSDSPGILLSRVSSRPPSFWESLLEKDFGVLD